MIGDVFKCASQRVLLQQKYYFEIDFSCNWIFLRFRGVVLMHVQFPFGELFNACPVSNLSLIRLYVSIKWGFGQSEICLSSPCSLDCR